MTRWSFVIVCLVTGCVTTAAEDDPAAQLAVALDDGAVSARVLASLQDGPQAWNDVAAMAGLTSRDDGAEVWLRAGNGAPLVARQPPGNERSWTSIAAFRAGGEAVTLDVVHAPDAPVLIIERRGSHARAEEIAEENRALQRAGLQHVVASAAAIDTTKLDSVRLVDDQEPWISGAAEIYAVVSGVVGANQPEVHIVDMPYLDNDGTTYTPNQIVIDWSGFQYRVANVQLFEHDDNTNYQTLVMALVTAIGEAGTLAGKPTIQAVTEIANRIIAAIPASVFTNDDDYVDSFYTIEQGHAYGGLVGAGRNATVTLSPFVVQSN